MNIAELMKTGGNVQIVCNLHDLKEVFNQFQDERDAMQPAPKEDKMLSAEEAATVLHVTSVTLWRWATKGYLKPLKVGRKLYYWQSAIDDLLKKKEG